MTIDCRIWGGPKRCGQADSNGGLSERMKGKITCFLESWNGQIENAYIMSLICSDAIWKMDKNLFGNVLVLFLSIISYSANLDEEIHTQCILGCFDDNKLSKRHRSGGSRYSRHSSGWLFGISKFETLINSYVHISKWSMSCSIHSFITDFWTRSASSDGCRITALHTFYFAIACQGVCQRPTLSRSHSKGLYTSSYDSTSARKIRRRGSPVINGHMSIPCETRNSRNCYRGSRAYHYFCLSHGAWISGS
jgi:hypothetical protein